MDIEGEEIPEKKEE